MLRPGEADRSGSGRGNLEVMAHGCPVPFAPPHWLPCQRSSLFRETAPFFQELLRRGLHGPYLRGRPYHACIACLYIRWCV